MRSFEDRWVWLRGQLEDDAATLFGRAHDAEDAGQMDRSALLDAKACALRVALDHMDLADRNGPVEPL